MCCFSVSQPADTFIHSATAVLCSDANVSCSCAHHLFYHIYGILICHAHISTNIRLRRIYSRHYRVSHKLNVFHMGAAVMANYEKKPQCSSKTGFSQSLGSPDLLNYWWQLGDLPYPKISSMDWIAFVFEVDFWYLR